MVVLTNAEASEYGVRHRHRRAWTTADAARANAYAETQAITEAYWTTGRLPASDARYVQDGLREYVELVRGPEWRLMLDGRRLSPRGRRRLDDLRRHVTAVDTGVDTGDDTGDDDERGRGRTSDQRARWTTASGTSAPGLASPAAMTITPPTTETSLMRHTRILGRTHLFKASRHKLTPDRIARRSHHRRPGE